MSCFSWGSLARRFLGFFFVFFLLRFLFAWRFTSQSPPSPSLFSLSVGESDNVLANEVLRDEEPPELIDALRDKKELLLCVGVCAVSCCCCCVAEETEVNDGLRDKKELLLCVGVCAVSCCCCCVAEETELIDGLRDKKELLLFVGVCAVFCCCCCIACKMFCSSAGMGCCTVVLLCAASCCSAIVAIVEAIC